MKASNQVLIEKDLAAAYSRRTVFMDYQTDIETLPLAQTKKTPTFNRVFRGCLIAIGNCINTNISISMFLELETSNKLVMGAPDINFHS